MNLDILKKIRERGLLLEKEVFDIVNSFNNMEAACDFLEKLERFSGQKIITKAVLNKNFEYVQQIISSLPGEDKKSVENIFVKLGFQFEIRKEQRVVDEKKSEKKALEGGYQLFYGDTKAEKKIEVADFVSYFRFRYQQMQRILMQRQDLANLISINKISGERQQLSVIGIVSEKRITKNKNFIIKLEDLTGGISVMVKGDKAEISEKAGELQLDDVIAVKASGNREMLFAQALYYPDAFIHEKVKFDEDVTVAFLSDLHCGSDRHLGRSFEKFLEWVNSSDVNAKKIKYIFFSGDNVDGVGIFPGQENVLALKSMKEQYALLAGYLKKIPKHITMFMCPGQHDATRVAEPQPVIDKKYAEPLYYVENLVLVPNPTLVKLIEGQKVFKVLMYHGASIHTFINEVPLLRETKAHRTPAKAVQHMLKRRHLAPTHSSAVYIPYADADPLFISEVPDVLCTGEVHRPDIENYNGVLIITGSCWQAQTPFEEKVGNIPDPAKVPVLNLKTRELKIYDFGIEEELKNGY